MTRNISFLSKFEEINGGYVAFGGDPKGGKISGKGKNKTVKLDFDDVYFVKELKFNLFSVSQIRDKKKSVLFIDTKCVVSYSDYKLPDENHVLLRVPRKNNMYNVDLKNVVPSGGLTCLFAKATLDESNLWHRRLGYINFKTMNKLVKRNLFFGMKGIKREFSVARTQQQNEVAERKNRTLIKAARTMLADSLLPITFWAKAVNIACYVQNRVLVTKPHNKTPYELLLVRSPSIGFMRPFGCPVTILNTLGPLGKFDGKADEGFLVGYSLNCKAFRVYNSRTRIVQETLHINFLENKPNVAGIEPKCEPVNVVGPNPTNNTNSFNTASPSVNAVSLNCGIAGKSLFVDLSKYPDDPYMPELEDIVYSDDEEDVGAKADLSNLETNIHTSPIPTTRVHKAHPINQIIGDLNSVPQTRSMTRMVFGNKKDERGIVIRNKARLVAQGHTQEEGINYNEFFAPVVRIETIRLFLAYASFMGFMVYQMDVKSDFLYETIKKEVYVCQPLGFEDVAYLDKVYKVVKALYGLHQASRA
nr:putative ribonuclease H-like domain-containing protein [Tanacetum cinerariifolium]